MAVLLAFFTGRFSQKIISVPNPNSALPTQTRLLQPTTETAPRPSRVPTITLPPIKSTFSYPKVAYMINNDIWTQSSPETAKQITQTNGSVSKVAYHTYTDKIAFIKGEVIQEHLKNKRIEPSSVHLISRGIDKEILSLTYSTNGDYTSQLRDLAFSNDGSLLAITTSDSVYIYTISTDQIKKVYTSEKFGHDLYAFLKPVFSPDNQHVLLTIGYQEGSSNSVLNLQTTVLTDLGNSSYVSGIRYLGWDGSLIYGISYEYGVDKSKVVGINPNSLEKYSYFEIDTQLTDARLQSPSQFVLSGFTDQKIELSYIYRHNASENKSPISVQTQDSFFDITSSPNSNVFFASRNGGLFAIYSSNSHFELNYLGPGSL